jgi:hypothetical protein
VNHWKPRKLGVASAIHHSWLGSHVFPAQRWFWGSTKKPSMTSSYCSCHHAARTWPRWPRGPSNEAYLSSPRLEASPATTFRACPSPAPTPVKLQPAPAILSQESVHTTLSITHHTRMRPSTGPRTTHGLHSKHKFCIFLHAEGLIHDTKDHQPSFVVQWSRMNAFGAKLFPQLRYSKILDSIPKQKFCIFLHAEGFLNAPKDN